jgi:hypothetical protein
MKVIDTLSKILLLTKEYDCVTNINCFCILDAVRRNPATCRATDEEIANQTKEWLKHAPDRDGGRSARRSNLT